MTNDWLHKSTKLHFQVVDLNLPFIDSDRSLQYKRKRKENLLLFSVRFVSWEYLLYKMGNDKKILPLSGLVCSLCYYLRLLRLQFILLYLFYWANLNDFYTPISISIPFILAHFFWFLPSIEVANWLSMCYYRLTVFI